MARDDRDIEKKLDKALLACLPKDGTVVSCVPLGLSDYCDTLKIDVRVPDDTIQTFFAKISRGQAGYDLLLGTNASESSLHSFIPEHVPRPLGFSTYESDPDRHFFLMEWVDMRDDDLPEPEAYMAPVVALHSRSMGMSPTGKFGFGVNTAFGNLPQVNKWEDSWEKWWTDYMTMILDREESLRGPHTPEDKELKDQFLNKVLPRYLRPLESNGRSIKPCLLHADLWPGNIKYQLENETAIVYDSSGLWGHNEVDLGVIRNPRYPLGRPYLKEYWKHIPISEPQEDADSRNIMYLVRNQALLASLYPEDHSLRNSFVKTMRVVVDRVLEEEARGGATNGVSVSDGPQHSAFAELEKNGVSQPRVAQLETGGMNSTD
ncbi:hypothetical protein CDV31_011273 [Fusarium ambrosium]|uniref:protein-ribulosamine 3-kinase n=1 Tax=Fusarium ambrosium TaxID=131363 RepID=A0A428THY0_9HYPO|nr:hypothetical protein CDV31_011273 [Fusarium ambrosium]